MMNRICFKVIKNFHNCNPDHTSVVLSELEKKRNLNFLSYTNISLSQQKSANNQTVKELL